MVPGRIPCDATVYKQMDPSKSLTEYASLIQDSFKQGQKGESTKKKNKNKKLNPIFCTFQFWLLFNTDYTKLWDHNTFTIQKMYFYISVWYRGI